VQSGRLTGERCFRMGFAGRDMVLVAVGFEPFVGPGGDRIHDAIERRAFFSQAIFDSHGGIGNNDTLDDTFAFEFLEPFGKESIMQTGDGFAYIGEAISTAAHGAEDCAIPALANEFYRLVESRTEGRNDRLIFHNVDSIH